VIPFEVGTRDPWDHTEVWKCWTRWSGADGEGARNDGGWPDRGVRGVPQGDRL